MMMPTASMTAPATLAADSDRVAIQPSQLVEAPATAMARNGMASPAEYVASNPAAWPALPCESARVNIAPRIGPAHGVQPAANVIPTSPEATALPPPGVADVRRTERRRPGISMIPI